MSIATQITRLRNARNTIRTKLVGFGLASSTDKLDVLATEINGITAQAAATITPSESAQTAVAAGKYTTGAVIKQFKIISTPIIFLLLIRKRK